MNGIDISVIISENECFKSRRIIGNRNNKDDRVKASGKYNNSKFIGITSCNFKIIQREIWGTTRWTNSQSTCLHVNYEGKKQNKKLVKIQKSVEHN